MNTSFYNEIKEILLSARNKVYQTANFAMVEAYWNIGKSIIEEQGGNEKAEYGTGLLKELSKQMTQDFGKGFTVANLKNMRQFYLTFPNGYALRSELSWTHYRLLMRVENENAREFYMQEAVKSQWSTRQLERQINSFFYERLLSSKNKEQVAEEIQTLEPAKKPEDIIRDPYVLEFLGLTPNDDFYESDLEQALITHLQKFLLELGRGFSFVARQKRITFDGRHFRIDLVFYNYILKCFVLIDLKVGDLTHQDLGQMQMYVHYYERELMNEHCYSHFIKARESKEVDYDYLSLQLAFYLASWGMYRGSSFLLQKDYRVHVPVVKELLNKKYDALAGIECAAFKEESNQKLLQDINSFLEKYYDKIRHEVKEQEIKNQLSYTLITKILMGTLGCVPAYDRYFIAGIKNQKVATGNYNLNSIMQLVEFYERNSKRLEPVREKMEVEGMPYPQMKMLDMGFWQVGFDLDTNKGIKTAH